MNNALIRHSSDLAILYRDFRSLAIFPVSWEPEKFKLSLKHVRSQARVGILYSERSHYYLVERH